MATRSGWWYLKLSIDHGELSDLDFAHIAKCIEDGYTSGEIVDETTPLKNVLMGTYRDTFLQYVGSVFGTAEGRDTYNGYQWAGILNEMFGDSWTDNIWLADHPSVVLSVRGGFYESEGDIWYVESNSVTKECVFKKC